MGILLAIFLLFLYVFPPPCFLAVVFMSRSMNKVQLCFLLGKTELSCDKGKTTTLQRLVVPLATGRAETERQGVSGDKWENKGKRGRRLPRGHLLTWRICRHLNLAFVAAWHCQWPRVLWDTGSLLAKVHLGCNSTPFSEIAHYNLSHMFSWVRKLLIITFTSLSCESSEKIQWYEECFSFQLTTSYYFTLPVSQWAQSLIHGSSQAEKRQIRSKLLQTRRLEFHSIWFVLYCCLCILRDHGPKDN